MYNIFITHAFRDDADYNEIVSWLKNSNFIDKINITSEPDKSKLPEGTDLRAALVDQIDAADCVVVIEKMFENASGWMMHEFLTARNAHKRIILMKTLANTVKKRVTVPMSVDGGADVTLIWHEFTFTEAIRQGIRE